MKPSHTGPGKQWVGGFPTDDQPTAALLLDSLEIHDHVDILSSIGQQVRDLHSDDKSSPVLLVPIRSLEDLPELGPDEAEHVAYRTFNPGSSLPMLSGSEADIGGPIRTLVTQNPGHFLPPELSIDTLRELKVRTICLLTDYSGSGKQAVHFAQSFKANRTLASWISLGLLQIQVLTYASSVDASQRVRGHGHIEFSTKIFAKSANSANWSKEERERITKLCIDHADANCTQSALGYKNSFGLYLTNWRVPNNLPQILIRKGGTHPGVFADRVFPHDLLQELPAYRPQPSLETTLRNLGAEDLAAHLEQKTRPIKGLRALAALYLLEYGMAENQIYAMLGLDPEGIRQLRSTLIALDCITLDNKLTRRGKNELRRARHRGMAKPKYKHEPHPPVWYKPTQLR